MKWFNLFGTMNRVKSYDEIIAESIVWHIPRPKPLDSSSGSQPLGKRGDSVKSPGHSNGDEPSHNDTDNRRKFVKSKAKESNPVPDPLKSCYEQLEKMGWRKGQLGKRQFMERDAEDLIFMLWQRMHSDWTLRIRRWTPEGDGGMMTFHRLTYNSALELAESIAKACGGWVYWMDEAKTEDAAE